MALILLEEHVLYGFLKNNLTDYFYVALGTYGAVGFTAIFYFLPLDATIICIYK